MILSRFSRITPWLVALLLMLHGAVRGQETPPKNEGTVESTPAKTQKFADLTVRYRFTERYSTDETRVGPGVVGSYRVAIRESVRESVESAQGAPKRTDSTRQSIYTERPAEIGPGVGIVASSVRNTEKDQGKPEENAKATATRTMEGTTILVRSRVGEYPLILSLTEGRSFTEAEYDALSRQIYVPNLPALLPSQAVRLGDIWRISKKATQALLGDPVVAGDILVGKLVEVRKELDGPRMVASISITGKVPGAVGESTVNAEVTFTFQGTLPSKERPKKSSLILSPSEDTMEARGAITELRLASITSGPVAKASRLRFQANRELTMHRQLGVVAGGVALPLVDNPPPATEANSWLTHFDASGRYALRHPQDLLAPDRSQAIAEPNTTLLARNRREGRDLFQVEFVPRTLTPEDLKKKLAEKYALLKMEVLKGDETWLPDKDWPGMRVHRIDAALKVRDPKASGAPASTRVHFDAYLIQFAQSSSILAIASTSRETVAPFREEVEKILKTIQLDPVRPPAG